VIRYRKKEGEACPTTPGRRCERNDYVRWRTFVEFQNRAERMEAALDAEGNWQEAKFDDSRWKDAITFTPPRIV